MTNTRYQEPDPTHESKKILHSILKLEGAVIIESIHQIIRIAQAEYDAMVAQIESRNAREDRAFGRNLEVYYKKGVLPPLISLVRQLAEEIPGDESKGLLITLEHPNWTEFFSNNTRNLEGIATHLRMLLNKLN